VRRTAWGLGRLARNAGVLGVIGLGTLAGAGTHAAPAPDVFALTIRATAVADFDHTTAPVESAGCTTTSRAEGFLTVHFGTRRPVLVRFVSGRVQPVTVRPLDGTAVLHGTNELDEVCPPTETHSPESCRATTRTFRNARATLRNTRPGLLTVGAIRLVLRRINCPREPDELRRALLAPVPGPVRVSTRTLANERTTRITLTASGRRTLTYGPLQQGFLQQRSTWTFTFVRTAR
jgi:hypothetical protein